MASYVRLETSGQSLSTLVELPVTHSDSFGSIIIALWLSTGYFRPEIWIGEHVRKDAQLRVALNHELCHIASNDPLTLFLIVAVERLLWWNPLTWLLGREARRQMEYACDRRCQSLIGKTKYRRSLAELLLEHEPCKAALAMPLVNR